MRVIFLDFDGVLNSSATFGRQTRGLIAHIPADEPGMRGLDPANAPPLLEILKRSGASIVISSSWRLCYTLEVNKGFLAQLGIDPALVIGETPRGGFDTKRGIYNSSIRGYEIQDWLTAHPGVTDFVILDDANDMAHLRKKLVQTSDATGLTMQHVKHALRQLGIQA
jgi:hypothetical protein